MLESELDEVKKETSTGLGKIFHGKLSATSWHAREKGLGTKANLPWGPQDIIFLN